MSQFRAISLSYKQVPLEVREKISLSLDESERLILSIKDVLGINEILVLSTCNRTEVYYSSDTDEDCNQQIIKLLHIQKGLPASIAKSFKAIDDTEEAVRHLFNVSMGLEAQVVGDLQISNQVKRAYQLSCDLEVAGPFLHRLMHTIFFTNKRVVQETAFRDGAASVSYATVELVEEFTSVVKNPKVLVIGAGEIGLDVVRNFVDSNIDDVVIINRTREKAESIAAECGFKVDEYDNLYKLIAESDVIISSVSKNEPIITREAVDAMEILTYKYFIDLAVPRSMEKEVDTVNGAILYNIDNIQSKSDEALQRRKDAIPAVSSLIDDSLSDFSEWRKQMEVSPVIQKLKSTLEEIRKEEVARYLKKMGKEEAEVIDAITKNLMQKVIKLPVMQLKAACKRGEAETLVDVLNGLFNLVPEEAK